MSDTDIADQRATADLIGSFYARMLKTPKERRTVGWMKTNLETLHELWKDFNDRHRLLARTDDLKDNGYFVDDVYGTAQVQYVDVKSHILNLLSPGRNQSAIQADEDFSDVTFATPPRSPLPPLDLPKFSGQQLEWETFKEMYLALVHNVASIAPVLKLQYLIGSLTGDAAHRLKNLQIKAANYEGAWNNLLRRYDNKRVIIAAHIHSLVTCPAVSKRSVNEFSRILDIFQEAIRGFNNQGLPVNQWDPWLVYHAAQKLDARTREAWEKSLGNKLEFPTFTTLIEFLETEIRALETAHANDETPKNAKSSDAAKTKTARKAQSHVASSEALKGKVKASCVSCKGEHFLASCETFRTMPVTQRWSLVSTHKLCGNCLKANHLASNCRSTGRCYVCSKKHHTSLHNDQQRGQVQSTDNSMPHQEAGQSTPSPAVNIMHALVHQPRVLLATAIVELRNSQGDSITIRALLDQGSEFSFVTGQVAQTLSLPRTKVNVPVLGIGASEAGFARSTVKLQLRSPVNSSFELSMQALVLKKLTDQLPAVRVPKEPWPHIDGLQLADPSFGHPGHIDCILGADLYGLLLTGELRRGNAHQPIAQSTVFGWVISGPTARSSSRATCQPTKAFHVCSDCNLDASLQAFWRMEEPSTCKPPSPLDEHCETLFESTISRNESGRFIVRLPLRETTMDLGDSKSIAVSRWLQIERKLAKNPQLSKLYHNFLEEYESLGHMERTREEDLRYPSYFMPHHGILKVKGDTPKIRVVFNASQDTTNGKALNDFLLPGPKLQDDLWAVITRWRLHRVVFMADIIKMFRQILIHEEDRDLQLIVWRRTTAEDLQIYRLNTVTYGTTSAPYLANKTLLHLAQLYEAQYPIAANIIRNNRYVDEFLVGADDLISAQRAKHQLIESLATAGFSLDKWSSNNVELIDRTDDPHDAPARSLELDECISTLGLAWLPKIDNFSVQVQPVQPKLCTKRIIASETAKLFDPLGWLGPFVIRTKVLIQDLWIAGVSWDTPLSGELQGRWNQILQDLPRLSDLKIPRWLSTTTCSTIALHAFADASERAYAACVYLVSTTQGNTTSNLILAKTRVAPIKTKSIPRLELCAVLLAAQLLLQCNKVLELPHIQMFGWSDSQVTLRWLADHPSKWNTFVATRVSEVLTMLPEVKWQYVPTKENPADLATRGATPAELIDSAIWWFGPSWLTVGQKPNTEPPLILEEELLERKKAAKFSFVAQQPQEELTGRFSTFTRLLRVIAFVLRYKNNLRLQALGRPEKQIRTPWLLAEELTRAHDVLIEDSQLSFFNNEIDSLRKGQPLPRKSPLVSLQPFLDNKGLLRVGGRLTNSLLSLNEKHPLILPKHSKLTQLLVLFAHLQTLHGGRQLTFSYLVRKYWIIHGKVVIKSIVSSCVRCARLKARTSGQLMGQLPSPRVCPTRPFLRSGVDYAGPINVRTSKGRGNKSHKGYFCILVCLATKATHIEVVTDLSAAAFIAALKRFSSRRGKCAELLSDNATNFHGTDAELGRLLHEAQLQPKIAEYVEGDGITWSFIPPGAPHFGGLWEAAVRSTKHHLRRMLSDYTLTYEELCTLTTQVEACLNSRPLYAMSTDPQDLAAITPAHLLIGSTLTALPEPYHPEESLLSFRDRWLLITQMRNQFWARWHKEYLHTLIQAQKWNRQETNLKIGDLVLVSTENTPPTKWPLGRVTQVFPRRDGLVRVVSVRTAASTLSRPVHKLCKLPVMNPEEEKTNS